MSQRLALFDLDNTLLGGDSDHAWGSFLIKKGIVEPEQHQRLNDAFYRDYEAGNLDIDAYVAFTLGPILQMDSNERDQLHLEFMQEFVLPMVLAQGEALVQSHRQAGDFCAIITATNAFITAPIAAHYGVDLLLATDLEEVESRFTGKIQGIPCYQGGKVEKLQQWLNSSPSELTLDNSIFYSDSGNDIPLLELVTDPVAVDPDPKLGQTAKQKGWRIISLRD